MGSYLGPLLFGGDLGSPVVRFVAAGGIATTVVSSICWSLWEASCSRAVAREDPTTWPGVAVAEAATREEVIHQFHEDQVKTQRYNFRLEVEEVYQLASHYIDPRDHACDESREPTSTPTLRNQLLYHGAPTIALKAIAVDGFRLPRMCPPRGRMFGRGIYFA